MNPDHCSQEGRPPNEEKNRKKSFVEKVAEKSASKAKSKENKKKDKTERHQNEKVFDKLTLMIF